MGRPPLALRLSLALALALNAAACRPPAGAMGPAPAAAPRPASVAPLVDRFAARSARCAGPVHQIVLGRAADAALLGDATLRQRVEAVWRLELHRCLTGEGYGGRPPVSPATVEAWLSQSGCKAFARAAFGAQSCLALATATAESLRTWERTARRAPAAPPSRKTNARYATRRETTRAPVKALGRLRGDALRTGTVGGSGGLGLRGHGQGGGGGGSGSAIGIGRLGRPAGTSRVFRSSVPGAMDTAMIRRVIRRYVAQVRRCYTLGLRSRPGLRGTIRMRIAIDRTGKVIAVTVASSSVNSRPTEQCLRTTILRWRFPPPSGQTVIVTYPFVFRPGGP